MTLLFSDGNMIHDVLGWRCDLIWCTEWASVRVRVSVFEDVMYVSSCSPGGSFSSKDDNAVCWRSPGGGEICHFWLLLVVEVGVWAMLMAWLCRCASGVPTVWVVDAFQLSLSVLDTVRAVECHVQCWHLVNASRLTSVCHVTVSSVSTLTDVCGFSSGQVCALSLALPAWSHAVA